ncbi:MAG: division/cell wall cluster transcriptional repressor MraZ [Nitrosomonadales bacterium]|jgi:MraZ protein|nr:division/cell wall cluster transcriptional repressor MraZ [Nitrosomonadales bacterium]MCH9770805.1 division/cell wall cluster transcriptional repressor MraZ [Betaproteobacteria bacterium]
MYRGATRLSLDGKNRISIPTKYREKILIESSGALVLTAHIYKCLLLYPQFAWEPIQEKIMNLSSFEKKSSGLQRLLVGFAEDITLDNANRLLIPSELKNYAEIDKNLIFIGQGSHFELWNCDNYYENLSQININEGNEFPEELKGFSL